MPRPKSEAAQAAMSKPINRPKRPKPSYEQTLHEIAEEATAVQRRLREDFYARRGEKPPS